MSSEHIPGTPDPSEMEASFERAESANITVADVLRDPLERWPEGGPIRLHISHINGAIANAEKEATSSYGIERLEALARFEQEQKRLTTLKQFDTQYRRLTPASHPQMVNLAKLGTLSQILSGSERGSDVMTEFDEVDRISRIYLSEQWSAPDQLTAGPDPSASD